MKITARVKETPKFSDGCIPDPKDEKQVYAIMDEIFSRKPWNDPFYKIGKIPTDGTDEAVERFNDYVSACAADVNRGRIMMYEVTSLTGKPSEELQEAMDNVHFLVAWDFENLRNPLNYYETRLFNKQFVIGNRYFVVLDIPGFKAAAAVKLL